MRGDIGTTGRKGLRQQLLTGLVVLLTLIWQPPATARGIETVRTVEGLSGPQPFVTILCRSADSEVALSETPSYFDELLGSAAPGLGDYWHEVAYGQINLEGSRVAGWYDLPGSWAAYLTGKATGPDLDRLAADCITAADADVHFPDYAGINLVFDTPLLHAWAGARRHLDLDGAAQIYGITWIGSNRFRRSATWAHEMGHALGLAHSTTPDGDEYSNPWDVMSRSGVCAPDPVLGSLPQHPIAYHKYRLGWISPERVYVSPPQGERTLELTRLALPGADGYLIALVPIEDSTGHFYTVEARRRVGYDVHLPADAVLIHRIDETQPLPARLITRTPLDDGGVYQGMWTVGSRFVDEEHGIAISVDAESAGGFIVTVVTGLPHDQAAAAEDIRLGSADLEERPAPSPPAAAAASSGKPVIAVTPQGGSVAVWVAGPRPRGGPPQRGDVWLARRVQRGTDEGTWEPVIRANRTAGLVSGPALAVDAAGNAYVAWTEGGEGDFDISFAYLAAGTREAIHEQINHDNEQTSGLASSPAVAVDPDGNAYATWLDARDGRLSISFATRPAGPDPGSGSWGANVRLTPLDAEVRVSPTIAAGPHGNVYVAWLNLIPCPGLRGKVGTVEARIRPARGEWGPVIRLASGVGGDELPKLNIVVKETGSAIVEWQDGLGEIVRAPLSR